LGLWGMAEKREGGCKLVAIGGDGMAVKMAKSRVGKKVWCRYCRSWVFTIRVFPECERCEFCGQVISDSKGADDELEG
jgi:hypothetical protein